jgi:hypothetical protein
MKLLNARMGVPVWRAMEATLSVIAQRDTLEKNVNLMILTLKLALQTCVRIVGSVTKNLVPILAVTAQLASVEQGVKLMIQILKLVHLILAEMEESVLKSLVHSRGATVL